MRTATWPAAPDIPETSERRYFVVAPPHFPDGRVEPRCLEELGRVSSAGSLLPVALLERLVSTRGVIVELFPPKESPSTDAYGGADAREGPAMSQLMCWTSGFQARFIRSADSRQCLRGALDGGRACE
jgi:hypothetical protein